MKQRVSILLIQVAIIRSKQRAKECDEGQGSDPWYHSNQQATQGGKDRHATPLANWPWSILFLPF